MPDREKVISTLEEIKTQAAGIGLNSAVISHKFIDEIIDLLKEQDDMGKELGNAVELIHKKNERIEKLLKEKEAVEPKTGHWTYLQYCANEGVYCSECHTKMFDKYPTKKKLSQFCGHCGAKMEGSVKCE